MTLLYDNQIADIDLSPHNILCSSSDFDGERYTRMPIASLLKLISNKNSTKNQVKLAQNELDRREFVGDVPLGYEIDVSHHAIDRVSTRHMHRYLNENDGQGIACWLKEQVIDCLVLLGKEKTVNALDGCNVPHQGMNFLFKSHAKITGRLVLVTVN